ncbi:DUF502 domain-containing protein [Candidatus Marinamargulisbacteria bacterium SCGC AG-439-L15]|nr:DUF502 domain-containing protein [Candidatus Marinamargulisbacteria bacterium SCGC AG-439-L15]
MSDEKKSGFIDSLKKDFFYGLLFILPIIATIWLVIFLIHLFSGPVSNLFGRSIPTSLSFVLTIVFITFIGLLARNIIGRAILKYFEAIISRIPFVNIVYKSFRQVTQAFSFQEKLLSAVMLEYPRKGAWALGFVTKEFPQGVVDKEGNNIVENMCSVFVPTTPNPTSGYFIYVKKEDLRELDMSVEESVKILMSAGVITPEKKQ